jgi:acetyl-CoA carboxylase carboxyl transferase subunit alpha
VVGGLGRFHGRAVAVLGTEKGSDTESRVIHNFGMARPEGYRKARRIIELAGRFGLPILSFVDTAGAFPGIEAEARGQAEAIARSIEACLEAPVPVVATIIGEGGSGGAIALAAADRVLMLEHSIYSVISPEGCASILWRDAAQAPTAAEALKLTADDLRRLNLVDAVVPEPMGGAHRDPVAALAAVGNKVWDSLEPLLALDGATLRARRREKFLEMGRHSVA